MAENENSLAALKAFFAPEGERMTIKEFKAEWDQLSEEEKNWFKTQPLK